MTTKIRSNELLPFLNSKSCEKGNYGSMNGTAGGKHHIEDHFQLFRILSHPIDIKYCKFIFPSHSLIQIVPRNRPFKVFLDIDGNFDKAREIATYFYTLYKRYYDITIPFEKVIIDECKNINNSDKGRIFFHNLLIDHKVYCLIIETIKIKYPTVDKISSIRMNYAYKVKEDKTYNFNAGIYVGNDSDPCVCEKGESNQEKCVCCNIREMKGTRKQDENTIAYIIRYCNYKKYSIFPEATYNIFEKCELLDKDELTESKGEKKEVEYDNPKLIIEAVKGLDSSRSVDLRQWLTIMVILYHQNVDIKYAHSFSRRCKEKYNHSEIEKLWNGMSLKLLIPYTSVLFKWYSEDNSYRELKLLWKKYGFIPTPEENLQKNYFLNQTYDWKNVKR